MTATPEPREILADRLIAATVARERIAREYGDSSPEALEAQAAVLRAHAAVVEEMKPTLYAPPGSYRIAGPPMPGSADCAPAIQAAIDSTKRKADFAELLDRYADAEQECALDPAEISVSNERAHLRAQVLATFNGLADLYEAQRESGGAS